MKHKMKYSKLVLLVVMLLVIISGSIAGILAINESPLGATIWVFVALALCFIGGYLSSSIDKEEEIYDTLKYELKVRLHHSITKRLNDLDVKYDDVTDIRIGVSEEVDNVINDHLGIE
jgi:hypothetical protein